MKNVLIAILFLTLGLMACGTDHSKHDHSDEAKTTTPTTEAEVKTDTTKHVHAYVCPMHPEVTSDKEGEKCPKCGMALEHKK